MKTIHTFDNVNYIINNKLDVYDNNNKLIPFIQFLNLNLMFIVTDVFGKWKYHSEY